MLGFLSSLMKNLVRSIFFVARYDDKLYVRGFVVINGIDIVAECAYAVQISDTDSKA